MYASVRDHIVKAAWPQGLKEGLEALGFGAVELEVSRELKAFAIKPINGETHLSLTDSGIEACMKQMREYQVRVSALLLSNDFGREDLDAEVNWVIQVGRAAAKLGVEAIRLDAIMRGQAELSLDQRAARFADCMKRILDTTAESVQYGIENHGADGNEPDFLDFILGTVNSPRLGITLDTGNFYWAGHPLDRVQEIMRHFASRVKHTHVKNICYPPDQRNVKRERGWEYGKYVSSIPEGDINHREVVKVLKAAGYQGDFCLEDESLGPLSAEERKARLIKDADFFREILA